MVQQYPAKLLFFGEYTIIHNSLAIALPYPYLKGQWSFDQNSKIESSQSNSREVLQKIYQHLKQSPIKNQLNLIALEKDLHQGIWFDSNIPIGYGCGSSGAVCAAIYDRYGCKVQVDLTLLQENLALIESFFHGQSSGVDPLVCYLNSPILIAPEGPTLVNVDLTKSPYTYFLIDTKIPRQTTPLVEYYLQKATQKDFAINCIDVFKKLNKKIIGLFLEHDPLLVKYFLQISQLEYQYFRRMIPSAFLEIWEKGFEPSSSYSLKLCGAGGGGYILGLSTDWEASKKVLQGFNLILVNAPN